MGRNLRVSKSHQQEILGHDLLASELYKTKSTINVHLKKIIIIAELVRSDVLHYTMPASMLKGIEEFWHS